MLITFTAPAKQATEPHKVNSVKSVKYLGLMLDQDLKWNEHIKYIGEKANKTAALMNKLNWMSRKLKLKLRRARYTQVK